MSRVKQGLAGQIAQRERSKEALFGVVVGQRRWLSAHRKIDEELQIGACQMPSRQLMVRGPAEEGNTYVSCWRGSPLSHTQVEYPKISDLIKQQRSRATRRRSSVLGDEFKRGTSECCAGD